MKELKISSPLEFDTFTSAVIDEKAYDRINSYIEYGRNSSKLKLLVGSPSSKKEGYYVKPTIFQTSDPHDRIMHEEIFGPVLSVHVYKDNKYDEVLDLVDKTRNYDIIPQSNLFFFIWQENLV